MNTQPDFEELLRLLENLNIEYMIIGGYAVAYHGYPRFTKDIDIFYRCTKDNVEKLRKALVLFGFSEKDLPVELFMTLGNVLTFGVAPVRVDLLNQIDGISFDDARDHIVKGRYGSVQASFIGFDDLIKNKKATQRLKDKADIEELLQSNT